MCLTILSVRQEAIYLEILGKMDNNWYAFHVFENYATSISIDKEEQDCFLFIDAKRRCHLLPTLQRSEPVKLP